MSTTLALLAAHLLGDFPLQPDSMAKDKLGDARVRLGHVLIHWVLTVVLLLPYASVADSVWAASYVAVFHFIVDSRQWVDPDAGGFDGYPMAVDQTLHVLTLYTASGILLT